MNKKTFKKSNATKPLPTKKKIIDKNQLLAYLLAVLIIFWTVAGVFGMIAFGRTSKKSSSVISASAQTADDIESSETLELVLPYLDGLTVQDKNGIFIYTAPKLYIGKNSLHMWAELLYVFSYSQTSTRFRTCFMYLDDSKIVYDSTHSILSITEHSTYDYYFPSLYEFDAIFIDYMFDYNESTSCLDVTITLKMDYDGEMKDFSFTISYFYYSTPVDVNKDGYFIPFISTFVPYNEVKTINNTLGYGIPTAEFLSYYNLASSLTPDSLATYEMAYNKGFNEGKFDGLKETGGEAFNDGYLKGYDVGKQEGFSEGKVVGNQEGVSESDVYTFSNFLSAIFDVPVRTFTSLLNFEILGINLLNFFLAFLSVGVILAVIRLFL